MLVVSAPAKINLGLAVHGRRPDGYHDISTIFVKVSLVDTLHFTPQANHITVHCDHPLAPGNPQNLVYKAAAALQALVPTSGVQIQLHKTIPVAAGLGGGSSDAATTLQALNTLWSLQLEPTALHPHAVALGADVPFFLLPTVAAFGTGRGDVLEPLTCPVRFYLVLVTPPIAVSTAWAYRQLNFELTRDENDTNILRKHLESGDIEGLGAACFNDFEAVVFARFPVLQEVRQALMRPGVYSVSMSGSGPTMYALCASHSVAQDAARAVQHRGWDVWVCQPWHYTPSASASCSEALEG